MCDSRPKRLPVALLLLLALGLCGCSDDTPTNVDNWEAGLVLNPEDGAVITANFDLTIGTNDADSMVVYLDEARMAHVVGPSFVLPVIITDYAAGYHTLRVMVFAGEVEKELSAEVLLCHGEGANVGNFAPSFGLTGLDGNIYSPAATMGTTVILLDFWASWCPPCRAALPETQRLMEEYGDQGLKVLTIDGEAREIAASFIAENGYTFPVLLDEDWAVGEAYDVRSIPKYLIIDRRGIVRYVRVGSGDTPLEDTIKPLL